MPTLADLATEVIEERYGTPRILARELYLATCGLPFVKQLEEIFPDDARNAERLGRVRGAQAGPLRRHPDVGGDAPRAGADARHGRPHRRVVEQRHRERRRLRARRRASSSTWCSATAAGLAKGRTHLDATSREFGASRQEMLFVGDSLHDGEIAEREGIPFVGVATTFSPDRFALRFPSVPVIRRFSALPELFVGLAMQAVLLAAGLGSRLGALTEQIPKALIAVGERPLLAYAVRFARAAGRRRDHGRGRVRLRRGRRRGGAPGAAGHAGREHGVPRRQPVSLTTARPFVEDADELLLMNVDHIYRPAIAALAAAPADDVTAFVDTDRTLGADDMKVERDAARAGPPHRQDAGPLGRGLRRDDEGAARRRRPLLGRRSTRRWPPRAARSTSSACWRASPTRARRPRAATSAATAGWRSTSPRSATTPRRRSVAAAGRPKAGRPKAGRQKGDRVKETRDRRASQRRPRADGIRRARRRVRVRRRHDRVRAVARGVEGAARRARRLAGARRDRLERPRHLARGPLQGRDAGRRAHRAAPAPTSRRSPTRWSAVTRSSSAARRCACARPTSRAGRSRTPIWRRITARRKRCWRCTARRATIRASLLVPVPIRTRPPS